MADNPAKRKTVVFFNTEAAWQPPGPPPTEPTYRGVNMIYAPIDNDSVSEEEQMFVLRLGEWGVFWNSIFDVDTKIRARFTDFDHVYYSPPLGNPGFVLTNGEINVVKASREQAPSVVVEDSNVLNMWASTDEVGLLERFTVTVESNEYDVSLGSYGGSLHIVDAHVTEPAPGIRRKEFTLYVSQPGDYRIDANYFQYDEDTIEHFRDGTYYVEVSAVSGRK